jgi:L-ribulose-5-phosphate 3-epimerase UlaE
MNNKIGVMQGRLLPKYKGRYQAHPVGYWQDEFLIAKDIGIDLIEFIFDLDDANSNPLINSHGKELILNLIASTNVGVQTICADYFMHAPIHSPDKDISYNSLKTLEKLLVNASEIGVKDIVIPCVDHSSLNNLALRNNFIKSIKLFDAMLKDLNINLSLETDLKPKDFLSLMESINSNHVKINYDLGNSASLGYDINEEFNAYGKLITDIHIKDRNLGGSSVILGTGNANFDKFFLKIKEYNYRGPLIMQAYRDDEINTFKDQFIWFKNYISNLYES